jgi:type IV pilus assembly protein PilC
MPSFACRSRDASGAVVERTLEAASRREALGILEASDLAPIDVTELRPDDGATARPPSRCGETRGADQRLRPRQLRRFSIQLASSLRAGVPVLAALRSLRAQAEARTYRAVLTHLMGAIEGGSSLSAAMRDLPRAFPAAYVGTIEAGEKAGSVDETLDDLAGYLEAEMDVRADVRSALTYPAIVVGVLLIACVTLVGFVVPRFAAFYSGFDTRLPLPTRILIGGSRLVQDHGGWIVLGAGLLALAGVRLSRLEPVRRALDRWVLGVPVLGHMLETAGTLRVVQMLRLATGAGVPLLESLRTIAMAIGNRKIRGDLWAVAAGVEAGRSLSDGLEAAGCLPFDARQMLATGEESGSLQQACAVVAEQYRKELRYLAKNLATFIEPLLTLFLAAFVLFLALAAFLPMWDMVKLVGK